MRRRKRNTNKEHMRTSPLNLMIYGFLLLLLGFLLAFGMVIGVLEPGFLLSFVSYSTSLAGLIVGLFGAVDYVQRSKQ